MRIQVIYDKDYSLGFFIPDISRVVGIIGISMLVIGFCNWHNCQYLISIFSIV